MPKPNKINFAIEQAKQLVRETRKRTLVRLNHIIRAIMFSKSGQSAVTTEYLEKHFRFSLETVSIDIQRLYFDDEHILDVDWVECEIYACTPEMEEFIRLMK